MQLNELRIRNLRNIETLDIEFAPGLNVLTGSNGAGKTSILESAHLLSHGSSFRTHRLEHLIRRGADELSLFGRITTQAYEHRVGMMRRDGRWSAKLDGVTPATLSMLFSTCAVVCFEPGSHALISGPAEGRRSFLDWGLFHVEPEFALWSRRYRRALRQRNALLKQQASDEELTVWDEELILVAEPLTRAREAYAAQLLAEMVPLLGAYLPELESANLRFRAGWDREISFGRVLVDTRSRDRLVGHTTRGPHRADWVLSFALAPVHEQLSRGQEKLCAISCMLAQARLYERLHGEWPIIALDDFCSELDATHQALAMATLAASGAQVLLTGTELPASLLERFPPQRRFHVEQGRAQALL